MQKAIFFDRDGTLMVDKNYLKDPSQIEFFPETLSALKELQNLGYLFFVVTNQSGIGRGFMTASDVELVHHQLNELLMQAGLHPIKSFAYCPHLPEAGCPCRKPSPYLIEQILTQHPLIDRAHSWMLGDKVIDVQAGHKAGLHSALVHHSDQQYLSFSTLSDFVLYLKNNVHH